MMEGTSSPAIGLAVVKTGVATRAVKNAKAFMMVNVGDRAFTVDKTPLYFKKFVRKVV